MTKRKIAQEDWIKIGTSLKKVRKDLLDASIITDDILGITNKSAREIDKALDLLDRARCQLENQMFRENPDLSNYWLNEEQANGRYVYRCKVLQGENFKLNSEATDAD